VRGLTTRDFRVRDSGHDVGAVDALELSDLPLDLLLVHQNRASLTPDQQRVFATSLSALMSAMRPDDRIAAITTGLPPRVVLPFGSPGRSINLSDGGATESALWDSIALALTQFDSAERRQVIVILSAGADRRSLLTPTIVLREASRGRAQIVFCGFDMVPAATHRLTRDPKTGTTRTETTVSWANRFPPADLQRLADATAGQVVNLGGTDPAARVREVVDRLRVGYLLSFAPRTQPGWHPVQVDVRRRGVRVAARAGYFR
jgi:hypothetical protein